MLQYTLSIKLSWCQRAPKTVCYKISQNTKFIFFTTFGYCGSRVPHIIFCKLPILRLDKLNQSDLSLSAVYRVSFYNKGISGKFFQTRNPSQLSYCIKLTVIGRRQESLCLESWNKLPVRVASYDKVGESFDMIS